MKKSILTMLAVAGIAALQTSCSEEQIVAPVSDGNVTFTVSVPGSITSRAFADGTTAQNNVVYYVYDVANGTDAEPVLTGNVQMASLRGSVTLGLATGHSYDVVFLATSAAAPYSYSTTGRDLTVDYTALVNSNEDLDAFYDVVSFEVTSSQTYEAQLTRPFAQLNIGTKDLEDYQKVTGKTVTATSVTISQLYTTINLMDGTPSDAQTDVTFKSAALPQGETFPMTYTPAGATEAVPYTYLAMDYLLVPAAKDIVEVTMTVEDGTGVLETTEYSNIPVQANYRTNIYGALLTSQQDFNVEILPGFGENDDNEYNVPNGPVEPAKDASGAYLVTNPNELAWITDQVNSGADNFSNKTIKLADDLDMTGVKAQPLGLFINTGGSAEAKNAPFKGTFDGQGHTISNFSTEVSDYKTSAGFFGYAADGAVIKDLTLKNINVTGTAYTGALIGKADKGSSYVTVDNVTIDGATILSIPAKGTDGQYDGGNNVGGLIGITQYGMDVQNCTVMNSTITGYAKVGGMFGTICNLNQTGTTNHTVYQNNKVENTDVIQSTANAYEDKLPTTIGEIYGFLSGQALPVSNTSVNVTVTAATPAWDSEATEAVTPVNGVYTIANPAQLNYLIQNIKQSDYVKPGVTINIDTDIDFTGTDWTPIRLRANLDTGYSLTFDFNGHTLTGLSMPFFEQFEGTIKNLTVKNAHITSTTNANGYYGVVACNHYGTLDNVHVVDCVIDCQGTNRSVGGISGQYSSGSATNCSVENLVINNATDWKAGGLFGTMLRDGQTDRSLTDCTATGVTITDYAGDAGGAILGRAVNINLTLTGCSATDCNPSVLVGKNVSSTITEN